MQESIQTTPPNPRGRPRKISFLLPFDDRLTSRHTLIDVGHEVGKIYFSFHADETEGFVLSYKPKRTDFAPLMDAVKAESLIVGQHSYPVRGAVKEHFHAAVIAAHYRSLDKA